MAGPCLLKSGLVWWGERAVGLPKRTKSAATRDSEMKPFHFLLPVRRAGGDWEDGVVLRQDDGVVDLYAGRVVDIHQIQVKVDVSLPNTLGSKVA